MDKRSEKEIIRFYDRLPSKQLSAAPPACCHLANRLIAKSGHAPKRLAPPGASEPNSADLVADTMSTSVRKGYAHFKLCKFNKVAIFNGFELFQVTCFSRPCTLSSHNAFIWAFTVKAAQSELKRV